MAIKLCPIGGKINAFLFENESINLPLSLFLSIRIDLEEFQFQSEFEDTCIQLDFIKMKFNSFLDIENKEIEFALNPEDGYIDGSIYLDSQHVPVDISKISFSSFDKDNINAKFKGVVLFDYCGYEDLNQEFIIETTLNFENIFIPSDIISPSIQNLEIAKKKLSEFFAISELTDPVIENNGFCDVITFHKLA